jgi:membrane protein DedA with SNARE-associated domain
VRGILYSLLSQFTYLAMVLLLGAAGMGLPVSQDLVLLLGGLLASRGVTDFWPTLAAGYGGALLGDLLMHRWGKRLGPAAYEQPWVRKVLPLERQERLRAHFARHGAATIFVARHAPLVRAATFFLSGASGVPRWKVLLADAVSALLTVPLWVWLGFRFGEQLPWLLKRIHRVQWALAAAALVAVALWIWLRRQSRPPWPQGRRQRAKA